MKAHVLIFLAAMLLAGGCVTYESSKYPLKRVTLEEASSNMHSLSLPTPSLSKAPSNGIGATGVVFGDKSSGRFEAEGAGGNTPVESKRKMIYTAEFRLGIYDTQESSKRIVELAERLGGYVAFQVDEGLIVRVPADRFSEMVDSLAKVGRVLKKKLEAQDVTEQCTDLSLRLEAKLKYLETLQALLDKADDAEAMLKIQKEVGGVIEEIEVLRGRLRYLSDKVAFSTVNIQLQLLTSESSRAFRLPFPWVERLGIEHLQAW